MLYAFLGLNGECFDDSKRLFPFRVANNDDGLTIDRCKKLCFEDHGYVYAGVEHANECWCGNDRPTISPAPQSECSMPCAGDSSQKCGGSWRMNIYQKTQGSQPNPNPNPIPNSIPGLDPEMEAFLAEIYLDDTDIKEKNT